MTSAAAWLALFLLLRAEQPAVLVPATVGGQGVAVVDLEAATTQLRTATAASSVRLVLPADDLRDAARCVEPACLQVLRERTGCDYLLRSSLVVREGELSVRLELVDVRTHRVVGTALNAGPATFATAVLDLSSLTTGLLRSLAGGEAQERSRASEEAAPEPGAEPAVTFSSATGESPAAAKEEAEPAGPASLQGSASLLVGDSRCRLCGGADGVFLSPKDCEAYARSLTRRRDAMAIRAWLDEKNEESIMVNALWIIPPVILVLGLAAQSDAVTLLGVGTLPIAVTAGIADAVDAGGVEICTPGPGRAD